MTPNMRATFDWLRCHGFMKGKQMQNKISLADFTTGYIECAMWANLMMYRCEHGENAYECSECDPDEIEPELTSADATPGEYDDSLTDTAREQIERDCRDFVASNIFDLMASGLDSSQCGHDFALTRNRHGAGFWDRKSRGAAADAALDRLTEASHAHGTQDFVVMRDGTVEIA